MAPISTPSTRNPTLERALFEDFDSREAWQVYADWLQQQGDPYGERIALELQMRDANAEGIAKLNEHVDRLDAAHRETWMGPELAMYSSMPHFDEVMEIRWERGLIASVAIEFPEHSRWFGGSTIDLLKALFAAPAVRFLRSLNLHPRDPGTPPPGVTLEALRELLVVDRDGYWDLAHIDIGPLGHWLALAPRLERLRAVGGGIVIETLEHPRLQSLSLETAGLPEPTVRAVGSCRMPNLRELHVWFGANRNGAEGSNDMLEDLYTGRGVPGLRRLGLMNAEFQDEIAVSIASSKVLEQLTHLDLSLGTMTDVGAAAILGKAQRFSHLERIDLDDNFISLEMCERLALALPRVELGEQDVPHFRDGVPHYYVSVAE